MAARRTSPILSAFHTIRPFFKNTPRYQHPSSPELTSPRSQSEADGDYHSGLLAKHASTTGTKRGLHRNLHLRLLPGNKLAASEGYCLFQSVYLSCQRPARKSLRSRGLEERRCLRLISVLTHLAYDRIVKR